MRIHSVAYIAAGLLLAAACPAMAAYGGLVSIPTADIVGTHFYSLDMQGDNSLPSQVSDVRFLNTQFGLSSRFEAGVDFDFGEDTSTKSIFNGKYVFKVDEKHGLSLAGGIYGLQNNVKAIPYLVASQCLPGEYRLHLGGQRIERSNRWFVGMDKTVGKVTVMADYTSGDENCSSAGINYQFNDDFGLLIGTQVPNGGGDNVYTVHFVIGGNYRSCP